MITADFTNWQVKFYKHHVKSPITLYTKLDPECDQQVTVVGRPLTALGYVHRRWQVLSAQTDDCRLFAVLHTVSV